MSGRKLDSLIDEQHELAKQLVLEDRFGAIMTVAGADQAFLGDRVISAIVVCSYRSMDSMYIVERAHHVSKAGFPYIPTFLSFREAPPILHAWKRLRNEPDILLVDGQGIAHPRGIGLASHLGVLLDAPTIGIAKSWLFGGFRQPKAVGRASRLTAGGRQIGWVLLTRRGCNPIYISPGNKVSIESSLVITRRCLAGHRLPEPSRLAHLHANEVKQSLREE
ncbi:MAG: endonuclease V [Candidatus Aenigmarchaeota archaeon]|nr:endonuclease V [Candidatus Aenigmarchaeota archaeon]